MNKDELIENLKYLVNQYIIDVKVQNQLQAAIESGKAKYVLAEIDRNKKGDYSKEDIDLIQDIAFYYC